MKRSILTTLLLLPFFLQAQNTMYFMESLPQTNIFNPAFMPKVKFYVGLPGLGGISANAYNSGFNYNWLNDFAESVGSAGFDPNEAIRSIGEYDRFSAEVQANILSLGFNLKEKEYLSFMAAVNNCSEMKVASNIAYLLTDYDDLSSDDFPIVIDDLKLLSNSYISMGLTYSRIINDNLTLGISPHINFNFIGIRAQNISYRVEREYDFGEYVYDQTFSGEVYIGLPLEMNPEARDGNKVNLDEGIFPENWLQETGFSDIFKNKSLSLDVGGTYEWNQWTFSASILNIGASTWKKNGFSLSGNGEEINSLEEKITIGIPTKTYLGAKRQFSPNWNYGLLLHNRFYKGGSNASATFSLNGWPEKVLFVSASYTAGYKFNNFGLGFRLRFLPGTDLFFVTDNMIQIFRFRNTYRLSAAVGINISSGIINGNPHPASEE